LTKLTIVAFGSLAFMKLYETIAFAGGIGIEEKIDQTQ